MTKMTDKAEFSGDIAIVGMSCRFPGEGEGVDGFWQSITSGQSAWSQIPSDRFNPSAFWSPQKRANTTITRGGFFLKDDLAAFDAGFFTLPKAEANAMDPQQRLLIEVTYEALESAGIPLSKVAGSRTGVYVGVFTHDYHEMLCKDPENMPMFTLHGTASTAMAGRLSWLWDLRGPSFALDTACSSGLVALHLAVQGLRAGESDAALVGATNLLLSPDMFKILSNASFLAPDGRSKAFDESADGYGRGEGIGALMLKRVEDAVRDGDPIRAVIRQTACNQDGRTPGMTLPSSDAQAALIREAYGAAGLNMEDTGYVEAHGTGTQAGDQGETKSLYSTIASAKLQARQDKLLIGSVKSNIGHLEACAGIAAVIKTVLVLEHGLIPPTITAKTLNSKIPVASWNISIPTGLTPFPGTGLRRVSVNSFGFCGTNAHAILDDAQFYLQSRGIAQGNHFTRRGGRALTNVPHGISGINGVRTADPRPLTFILSAQDKEGIKRVRHSLASFLEKRDKSLDKEDREFLVDLAYTLNIRRTHHQWKTYAVASSTSELIEALNESETPCPEHLRASKPLRVGFVFTGQGAQWGGMGMELMAFKTFRESVLAADTYLKAQLDCPWSAEEELRRPKAESRLSIAEFSQPLCTVLQVALVDLFLEWGIVPTAVTGHSSGEIGAAYCLGAISREDAWKAAYYRGTLATLLTGVSGSMMAVGMSPEKAGELIEQVAPGEVTVACINSPSSVTLSGHTMAIEDLLTVLSKDGIFARKLQVDTAYHSHHMQMVASDYMDAIVDIQTKSGTEGCIMQSSATGTKVAPNDLGAAHWVRNLISPVQFAGAVQDLVRPLAGGKRSTDNAVDMLIEVGPHSALQGPSLQSLKAIGVTDVPYLSALSRWQDGSKTCLALAGDLFARAYPVNIAKVNEVVDSQMKPIKPRTLVSLPGYAWNHQQRYWAETRWAQEQRMRSDPPLSLLGAPQVSPVAGEHVWRGYMRMREQPWLADHQIQGSVLYPGAGFLAMAIEAAAQVADSDREVRGFRLRNVQLVLPMVLQEDHDVEYTIVLRPHLNGTMSTGSTWTEFVISSSPDGNAFERNCLGLILVEYAGSEDLLDSESVRKHIDGIKEKCKATVDTNAFYQKLTSLGLIYGPHFAKLNNVRMRPRQSTAIVDMPSAGLEVALRGGHRPHVIHPALLDAVFHTIFAAALGAGELTSAMIPKSIDSVFVSIDAPYRVDEQLSGVCETHAQGLKEYVADISMEDRRTGTPVLQIQGLCCSKVSGDVMVVNALPTNSLCTSMVWRPHIDLSTKDQLDKSELSADKSALYKLSKIIRLVHHVNPAMKLVELATSSRIILPTLSIDEEVFATTSYEVICPERMIPDLTETLASLGDSNKVQVSELDAWLGDGDPSVDFLVATRHDSEAFPSSPLDLARKILPPGGRLCLVDSASKDTINVADLQAAGFKTGLSMRDEEHYIQVIIKEAERSTVNGYSSEEVVILSAGHTVAAAHLSQELSSRGFKPVVMSWIDTTAALVVREKRCISLVELDQSLFEQLSHGDFSKFADIIKSALHITWVVGSDEDKPSAAMITGLLRVLHNEMPGLEPVVISADVKSRARPEELATAVVRLFATPMGEREFQLVDCVPHVSRAVPDTKLNSAIDHLTGPQDAQEPELMSLAEATANGSQIKLAIGKPGQLESVRFRIDEASENPLAPDELEIDVKASALNFRDVLSIMGLIPSPTLGIEAAGTVRRIGSAVSHLKVSDRVALIGNGAHASAMRGKAILAFKMPDEMNFEEAAALPIVSYTAWYGLVRIANARKGQTVLIHAGTGGVGQAAIQLARHLELEVFTTVSNEEKRQLVRDRYGVADDHILGSRDLGFARSVMKLTGGRGVDIVLNSLAGEALRRSWECLAPSGHFVEIGIKDIVDDTRLGMRQFMRGASFTSLNLKDLCDNQTELMGEIIEGTTPYLIKGLVKAAYPLVSYPVSDMIKALRLLQAGKHKGKMVLDWTLDANVPVVRSPIPPLKIDSGVILLVGGMGGLGRSIARMLLANGARDFCFLSRSGDTSAEARRLLEELADGGARTLVLACDVSDTTSLATALRQCRADLGPIQGVFQCAAVFRDVLFANMQYDDWTRSTSSKVEGSQNLSTALPDVDFFIMLSSYAGTFGNRGQANYAAGCAYQDALAHTRRALGQSAVSVDLGLMRDVGTLAENGGIGDIKEWEKVWGIGEHTFLVLMRLCMQSDKMGIGARVVTGLGTRAGSLAAGIKPPYYLETDPRFGILALVGGGSQESDSTLSGDEQTLSVLLPKAENIQHAGVLILAALLRLVAKMTDLSASDLDSGRFLHDYGIDSLGAIEVVNWALREAEARIAVFDVMAAVPMTVFCERVAARAKLLPKQLTEGSQ